MKAEDFEKNFKELPAYNQDAIVNYQRINILDKNEKPNEIIHDKKGVCVRIVTPQATVYAVLTQENLETLINEIKKIENGE